MQCSQTFLYINATADTEESEQNEEHNRGTHMWAVKWVQASTGNSKSTEDDKTFELSSVCIVYVLLQYTVRWFWII